MGARHQAQCWWAASAQGGACGCAVAHTPPLRSWCRERARGGQAEGSHPQAAASVSAASEIQSPPCELQPPASSQRVPCRREFSVPFSPARAERMTSAPASFPQMLEARISRNLAQKDIFSLHFPICRSLGLAICTVPYCNFCLPPIQNSWLWPLTQTRRLPVRDPVPPYETTHIDPAQRSYFDSQHQNCYMTYLNESP